MEQEYIIRSEFQQNYRYAYDFWAPYNEDAKVFTLAASGYTWSNEERKQLIKEGREPLEFNIIRRPLQFFSGYLRDNVKQIVYGPIEGSDEKTADQFTKLSYYIWDKGNGYPVFLDAADECLKSGMSLCGIQMDYSKDFINGDISFFKRTYNSFYLDPTFENISLEDCSFAITRDLVSRDYAKQLLPFVDPKIIDELPNNYKDDKFIQYHPQFTTMQRYRNLITYDQYYRKTSRKEKFLVDMKSGFYRNISDMSSEELKKLKFGIGRMKELRNDAELYDINPEDLPSVDIKEVDRPYVELHIILNGIPVYQGEDKTGITETYPFTPLLCYFEPSIWIPSQRVQGIAAANYFAQRQFNKRHMKIVDMMDSSISTGYKYLIGSVPNPEDMQQAGQNKMIGVDPENAPEGLNSVQELRGGNASPELLQYQQVLDNLTLTLSNVNESVLGTDEGGNTQVSGRLAEVRVAQGLRSNRKVFDNIETAQINLGKLVLSVIQKKYPPEKVKRIINEDPTQQFYDKDFEQYDVAIKEGVRTKTQRDAYYYELVNLKKEGIVNVPQNEIVNALAMTGLTDLKKAIEREDQMQAAQAAQAQELQQKQIELIDASTQEKLGLAQERRARVLSDLALKDERESEAQQNIAQATLDRAKAITEIAKMETENLLKVLAFVNQLEKEQAMGREVQKQQVQNQSDILNAETEGSFENDQLTAQMQQAQAAQNINEDLNLGG